MLYYVLPVTHTTEPAVVSKTDSSEVLWDDLGCDLEVFKKKHTIHVMAISNKNAFQ